VIIRLIEMELYMKTRKLLGALALSVFATLSGYAQAAGELGRQNPNKKNELR